MRFFAISTLWNKVFAAVALSSTLCAFVLEGSMAITSYMLVYFGI
jgi:hypothetical protein